MKKLILITILSLLLLITMSYGIQADSTDIFLNGINQYYQKNFEKAIKTFDQYLENKSRHFLKVKTLYYQTLSFIELNQVIKTKNNIKKLKQLGYEFGYLYWKLGEIYLNQENQFDSPFYSEALKQFKQAHDLGINSYLFQKDLAICYQGLGKNKKAATAYKQALKNNNTVEDYINLANLYKKIDNNTEAIKYYEKTLSLDSNQESVYLNLGNIYFNTEKYNKSINVYKKGLKINPSLVTMRFKLAKAYYYIQDFSRAKKEFEQVVTANNNYYRAYYFLGQIMYNQKQYKNAINMYEKCIEVNQKYAKAYLGLGNIYLKQKNFYKAVANFSSAIDKNKNNPDGHYYLALAYNKLNMKDAAVAELKTTLHLDSDFKPARKLLNQLMED